MKRSLLIVACLSALLIGALHTSSAQATGLKPADQRAKGGIGEYVLLNPEGKACLVMSVEAVSFA